MQALSHKRAPKPRARVPTWDSGVFSITSTVQGRFPASPSPPTGSRGLHHTASTSWWGHTALLTGYQEAQVQTHGKGALRTAVLQTGGRLRDGKLQLCAGITGGAAAQGHRPVHQKRSVSTSMPSSKTPVFEAPTRHPPSVLPIPALPGMTDSLLELKSAFTGL